VNGIITMSARTDPAAQPFAAALRDRFTSLSRALEYIIPSFKRAAPAPEHTLKGLLRTLLSPYEVGERDGPRFVIEGDDAPVGSHATTSLALSVHELATNAVKYGALINPGGQVTVTIRRTSKGNCELAWIERGGPALDEPPTRVGFGSQVLHRSITGPLGGTIARRWRHDGLDLRLNLPLANLAH
jgi:two-component sensor histidine kinase